jgi:hypothetical protein
MFLVQKWPSTPDFTDKFVEPENCNCIQIARFEVSTAGLLRIPVFWNMTLCRWNIVSRRSQAGPDWLTNRAAARCASVLRGQRQWNNRKCCANKVRFPHANFPENYPQFRHAISKMFANPVLGRKRLKHIGFQGLNVNSLPKAPNS